MQEEIIFGFLKNLFLLFENFVFYIFEMFSGSV